MEIRRLAWGILLILAVSFTFGVAVNFGLVRRFLRGEFRQGYLDTASYPGIRFITLAEAEDLFAGSKTAGREDPRAAVFVDSRSRDLFAAGHVPGARNIPLDELTAPKRGPEGPGLLAAELSGPPERILVIYCEGGDCHTSIALARLVHDAGFKDVRIFSGGWAEWSEAGLPVE
jgi:rhodanese-related sulfurtransferase